MKLLSWADLKALGHPYSKVHTWRLIQAGKFPAPIKVSGAVNAINTWDEDEYNAHLAQRKAARGP